MQSRNNAAIYLDDEPAGGEVLQTAFLEAICQHRSLIGDMGATLRRLGTAIAQSNLDATEKSVLVAGIDQHVHSAKSIWPASIAPSASPLSRRAPSATKRVPDRKAGRSAHSHFFHLK